MSIETTDFIFFRAPAFKIEEFQSFIHNRDPASFLKNPRAARALQIGSPSFYNLLQIRADQKKNLSIKEMQKAQKFILRMCYRPTPNGLFSGVGLGHISSDAGSDLSIDSSEEKVTISSDFAEELLKLRSLKTAKIFFNPTLYKVGREYRYYHYSEIAKSWITSYAEIPSVILKLLQPGPLSLAAAIEKLSQGNKDKAAEAERFLKELIEEGVLYSTHRLSPHRGNYLQQLRKLFPKDQSLLEIEKNVQKENLRSVLRKDEDKASKNKKPFLAQATYHFKSAYLHPKQIEKLGTCANLMNQIFSDFNFKKRESLEFKALKKYLSLRHEEQAVPLLSLTEENIRYFMTQEAALDSIEPLEQYCIDKLKKYSHENSGAWKISKNEIEEMKALSQKGTYRTEAPPYFSILSGYFDRENLLYRSSSAYSAIKYMGRLSLNTEVHRHCNKLIKLEAESYRGKILADIGFQSGNKDANNIMLRNNFNIEYINFEGIADKNSIELSDLFIFLKNNQIFLFSKKRHKIVIPTFTHAYNSKLESNFYFRTLGNIVQQNFSGGFWNWSAGFRFFEMFPRVVISGVIVSPKCWFLTYKDKTQKIEDFFEEKIKQLKIHTLVNLVEDDRRLPLDFSQKEQKEIALSALKDKKAIYLEEVGDIDQEKYEIIVGMKNTSNQSQLEDIKIPEPTSKRHSGSNHLYFKIYCDPKLGTTALNFLNQRLKLDSFKSKWFFIRYADPGYHLRIRFFFKNQKQRKALTEKMFSLLEELSKNQIIEDFQLVTYIPEIERYGREGIHFFEEFSFKDSQRHLRLLNYIDQNKGFLPPEELRFLAKLLVENLLAFFLKSKSEKLKFCKFHLQDKSVSSTRIKMKSEIKAYFDQHFLKTNHFSNVNKFFQKVDQEQKKKFLSSLIHMSLNRLPATIDRKTEDEIYKEIYSDLLSAEGLDA